MTQLDNFTTYIIEDIKHGQYKTIIFAKARSDGTNNTVLRTVHIKLVVQFPRLLRREIQNITTNTNETTTQIWPQL